MKTLQAKLALLLTIPVLGCNPENLQPLDTGAPANLSYVNVEANFCTTPRTESKQKIKYLFILDHSQSNQPGFPLTAGDVTDTDPTGARRYGPLVQFVNNLVPDPNNLTYFSLIDFNNNATQPSGMSGFDADSNDFLNNYVKPDWIGGGTAMTPAPYDSGFTNYQAALQLAYNLIQTDLRSEAAIQTPPLVTSTYQIIFVSDGVPTIASTPGSPTPTYTQSFLTDLSPVISNITGLKNDPTLGSYVSGIFLNTAYYYQNTAIVAAETLLQQMAQAGNGQYFQYGSGQGILYQSFAPPVRNVRFNLADVWVENQNVVAWDDGRLLPDSDGDGLPDEIELKLGSNPFSPDSDGNGVSDLVEYRTKGMPCNDAHCAPAGRDAYAICAGFSPSVAPDGTTTYPSSANDGLNDCEKFVLGATRTNFDSNGDFIPDQLSFKNSIAFIAGTSGAFLNPFGDPLNNYLKLKAGYPISISQSKVPGFTPRTNSLVHVDSPTDDTDCYQYTANSVAVLQPGNHIKVSVIENSSIIDNKPVMLNAVHSWNGSDSTIYFSAGDFQ